MEDPKSFAESLFDFSFSSFVTTKIIKLLYGLSMVMLLLGTLGVIVTGFVQGIAAGLLTLLIGVPLCLFIGLIYVRVTLELIVVMFRIAENVSIIAGQGGLNAAPTPAPAAAAANDEEAKDAADDAVADADTGSDDA